MAAVLLLGLVLHLRGSVKQLAMSRLGVHDQRRNYEIVPRHSHDGPATGSSSRTNVNDARRSREPSLDRYAHDKAIFDRVNQMINSSQQEARQAMLEYVDGSIKTALPHATATYAAVPAVTGPGPLPKVPQPPPARPGLDELSKR